MESHHIDRHFEVSAKTGENIEPSFIEICKVLISKRKGTTSQLKSTTNQNQNNNSKEKTQDPTRLTDNGGFKGNKCCPT